MAKYEQLAGVLERRIRRGDYTLNGLPTELELAEEVGVSRMTARRVLLELMDKGLLLRKPHGRLAINREHAQLTARLQLAFLAPAYSSPDFEAWRFAVERTAAKFKAMLRMVDFVHWDDPVISQTLSEFDGVFVVPSSEAIPEPVMERLARARHLVALDGDFTALGVPSVQLLPPTCMHRLGDFLYELGHRRIDCLNTQPRDAVIVQRLEQWQFWQKMHKVEGEVFDARAEPYTHATPRAYRLMKQMLKAGEFRATALVCPTDAAAEGAMRALHEHGLVIGKDVSVCSTGGSGLARYQIPSCTSLESIAPDMYLDVCMEWFCKGSESWIGPLLIQPTHLPLFVGESTGSPPAISRV